MLIGAESTAVPGRSPVRTRAGGFFIYMGKEKLNEEEIKEIQEGLENVKRGEVTSIEQVARELGITLK